ncbi:MAG: divalent-cation tolerance protein CutA [bacterium]
MENKYIQIFTTTENKKEAEKIADVLVKEGLATCVQIMGPIESTYIWKGKTKKSKEWLCLIKTKTSRYGKVEEAIKSIHSYKVPEIIATPIIAGSVEYLKWLGA